MNNYMKERLTQLRHWINRDEGMVFGITLFLHVVVVLIIYSGVLFPSPNDDTVYHGYGTQIASLLRSGHYVLGAVYPHHWYPLFVGSIYFFTGNVILYGILFNALLVALSAILLYKTIRYYRVSHRIALWTTLVVLNCYASLMYTTSLLLKEAWIIFLFITMLFIATKIIAAQKFSWRMFIIFVIAFIFLRNLRHPIAFSAMSGFFVQWLLMKEGTWQYRVKYILVMLGIVTVTTCLLMGDGILKNRSIIEYVSPQFVEQVRRGYRSGQTTGNLAVVIPQEVSMQPQVLDTQAEEIISGLDEVNYGFSAHGTFVSIINSIFGPFPWQLSLQKYGIALLDLGILYIGYILAVVVVRRGVYVGIPFFVIVAGLIASLSLGVDNIGALLRYRIPLTIVVTIVAAIGIQYRLDQKKIL